MKVIIAVPVFNEEMILEKSILSLLDFCRDNLSCEYTIIVADNNSTDATPEIGRRLDANFPEVNYFFLSKRGKGLAWREAFLSNEADVYCMMDVDLAVELSFLPRLIEAIAGGADVAIGSRHLSQSKVERTISREIISRAYVFLAKILLHSPFSDLQCGFKAINSTAKTTILSLTEDPGFFLDTEFLLLSHKKGLSIKEIPVNWSEFRNNQRKSTVPLWKTSHDYIKKCLKLNKRLRKLV